MQRLTAGDDDVDMKGKRNLATDDRQVNGHGQCLEPGNPAAGGTQRLTTDLETLERTHILYSRQRQLKRRMGWERSNVPFRCQQACQSLSLELPGHRDCGYIDGHRVDAFAAYFNCHVAGDLNVIRREVQRGTRGP